MQEDAIDPYGIASISRRILRRLPQSSRISREQPLQGVAQIAHKVPRVSQLDGGGGNTMGCLGIGTGPVPGNDLDAGMVAKPGGQRIRFPVCEQLDRTSRFQIDDDGAVPVAARQRSVTDADHRQRR
nr:hypothetical protein [Aromatoleum buckelii]